MDLAEKQAIETSGVDTRTRAGQFAAKRRELKQLERDIDEHEKALNKLRAKLHKVDWEIQCLERHDPAPMLEDYK